MHWAPGRGGHPPADRPGRRLRDKKYAASREICGIRPSERSLVGTPDREICEGSSLLFRSARGPFVVVAAADSTGGWREPHRLATPDPQGSTAAGRVVEGAGRSSAKETATPSRISVAGCGAFLRNRFHTASEASLSLPVHLCECMDSIISRCGRRDLNRRWLWRERLTAASEGHKSTDRSTVGLSPVAPWSQLQEPLTALGKSPRESMDPRASST